MEVLFVGGSCSVRKMPNRVVEKAGAPKGLSPSWRYPLVHNVGLTTYLLPDNHRCPSALRQGPSLKWGFAAYLGTPFHASQRSAAAVVDF